MVSICIRDETGSDEVWMSFARQLDHFDEFAVGRDAAENHSFFFEDRAIFRIEFVSVTMTFADLFGPVIDVASERALFQVRTSNRRAASCRPSRRRRRGRASLKMIGNGVCSLNSVESASRKPQAFRANSMQAVCMPRQMPKYGVFDFRAYLIARSIPESPVCQNRREPVSRQNPAARFRNRRFIRFSDSSQVTFTRRLFATPACVSASRSDLYESSSSTYLPTIAMRTTPPVGSFIVETSSRQRLRSVDGNFSVKLQVVDDQIVKALLVKRQRHLVDRRHIQRRNDGVFLHVAKQCDLSPEVARQRTIGTTKQDVRRDTDLAQLANAVLRRLCF